MKKNLPTKLAERILLVYLLLNFVSAINANAQSPATIASGATYSIDGNATPTEFVSFSTAIAALNATTPGIITSTVTFNVTAGMTFQETPSAGAITYTNSGGSATCQIIFITTGTPGINDPVISGITGTTSFDAVVTITGGNYYTFNGIDLQNDPGNGTGGPQIELGLNLLSSCNNITYENGKILLNNYSPVETANLSICGITDCTSQNVFSSVGTVNLSGNTINIGNCSYNSDGINFTAIGANSAFQNNIMTLASGNGAGGTAIGINGGTMGASTTISNNNINLTTFSSKGGGGLNGTTLGNTTSIYQNTITFTAGTATGTSYGINYSNVTGTGISIYGNSIGPVSQVGNYTTQGINVPNMGANGIIYQNTINVSSSAAGAPSGIIATSMGTIGSIRSNTITVSTTASTGVLTGISAGTMLASDTINHNIINVTGISPATGAATGIIAASMGTNGNIINNNVTVSTGTTGAGTGISSLTATGTTYNIAGNTVSVISAGAALGITVGVLGAGSSISNNRLTTVKSIAGSATSIGISSITMGATSNISGNTLGVTTTTSTGAATGITTGAAAQAMGANSSISNNTVTVNPGGTGAATGIVITNIGANSNIYGNTISATPATGAATGLNASSITNPNIGLYSNSITATSPGGISTGISGTSTGVSTTNIYNNTISSTTNGTSFIAYGMSEATLGGGSNVYNNSITATATGTTSGAQGITSTTAATNGANINFYGNTITAISASSTTGEVVLGISVSDNFLNNIYNNTITAISTLASSSAGTIATGISDAGTGNNFIYGNALMVMLRGGAAAYDAIGISEAGGNTANYPSASVYGNTVSVNSQATVANSTQLANSEGIYGTTANASFYNNSITNNKSGTITTSSGSTGVTGIGTNFGVEVVAGDSLAVNGVYIGKVSSVTNATSLALLANATINETNANYAVVSIGAVLGMGITGATSSIYGNTINGLTSGSRALSTAYGMYVTSSSTGVINTVINNNTIENIYSIGGTGVQGGGNAGGIYTTGTLTCYGNTISNIASGGGASSTTTSGNSYGIYFTLSSSLNFSYYYGNSISGISNLNTAATSANAYGVYEGGAANFNFYSNTISNVTLGSASSTGEATGLAFGESGSPAEANVFYHENKIFNISNATTTATGNANGIRISIAAGGNFSIPVYNNMIYHIIANSGTLAAAGGASRGIYISATLNTAYIYDNTIYLDGAATGATAQVSSCIYAPWNSSRSLVWNNILVNNSATTSSPSSFAFALWVGHALTPVPANSSSSSFTTYSNNLLWAGTPGTQHVLFNQSATLNGAPAITLANYQATMLANGDGDGTTSHTLTVPLSSFFVSPTWPSENVHLVGTSATDAYLQGSVLNSSTGPSLFSAILSVTSLGNTVAYTPPLPANDIDGDPRPSSGHTTIGADEPVCVTPVQPSAFTTAPTSISACSSNQSYAVPNIAGATFQWTVPTGVIINTGQYTDSINVSFLPTVVSPATISVATTSPGCGTSAARSVSVTINAMNPAGGSISGPATLCQSSTVNYLAYIPNATFYSWTLTNGTAAASISGSYSTNTLLVNANSTAGTFTLTVVGTDACGNSSTPLTYSVTVSGTVGTSPGLTATASGTLGGNVVCNNGTLTLTGSPGGMASYTWSGPNGYSSPLQSPVISNMTSSAGNGFYVLNAVDGSGCPWGASVATAVVVDQLTAVSISATPSAQCGYYQIVNFIPVANAPVNGWNWSGPCGGGWNTGTCATSGSQIAYFYNGTLGDGGNYALTVTDANGCSAGNNITITGNPLPLVTTSAVTAICQGGTTATLGVSAFSGASSYVWSDGGAGGSFTNNGGSTPNTVTYTAAANAGTPVPLTLTTSGGSCGIASALQMVTVNAAPVATASASPNPVCTGGTLSLTGGPAGMTTYGWSGPASYANATQSPGIVNPTTSASGVYSLTVTASNGCTGAASTASVTVNATPSVSVSPDSGSICPYNILPLNASGATTYSWAPTAGLDVVTGSAVNANPVVTTTYTVTGTSLNCSSTATAIVTYLPLPAVLATPANAVCTGLVNVPITVSGAATYIWSPTTDLTPSAGTGATETAQVSQLTFYTVTGTGANGCTANAIVPVATVATGGIISPVYSIICSGNTQTLTVTGAAGHDYQWQISTDNVNWAIISGATNTTYTTASGDGNTNKFYRLLAQSNTCWNVASTTAEVDISNPTITVTASNITDNSLTLSWSPTGTGNYSISYSGPSSATSTSVTPPKTITGLSSDGTYSVTVTQTGLGLTGCPASGTLTGVNTLCAMPTGVTLSSPAPSQIQVSWTGVGGADYRVYYRPLFSYNTYFTKDVSNASSVLLTKQGGNNLYASTTYEVYVSRLDCPSTGDVGQPTSPTNVTTLPTVTCATPVIDSVRSLCPVQIEVFIHDNGVNLYNVFIQRLTPSILAVNSYGVSGTYFTINTPYSGDQYLIAVEAKCGSALSSIYVWPGNVTIKPLCTSPNNLVLSNPTCHGFTASWNADQCLSNSASGYDLYLRVAGTINYNSYGVGLPGNGIGPNMPINWLTTGRTYQVFVRSIYNCNGFVTYGPTSLVQTITTLSSGCRDEDTEQPQENKPATQQYSPDNQEVFSLYPNPNNGEFIVDLSRFNMEEDAVRIEVFNMIGQTVVTHLTTISGGHMSEYINLPNGTSTGIYIVRLTAGKNVYTAKINVSK